MVFFCRNHSKQSLMELSRLLLKKFYFNHCDAIAGKKDDRPFELCLSELWHPARYQVSPDIFTPPINWG